MVISQKITIIAFCILAVGYFLQAAWTNLNVANLIGDQRSFENCQIKGLDGKLTNETIEIHQVDHGYKLVEAETMMGSIFGLGFIHAIDRLWQIDFYRKVAQGRTAEILGSETLAIDKYMRTLGMRDLIDYNFENMDQEEHTVYENYAAGVNKAVEYMKSYPIEYYLLWTDFEPFQPKDAMSMQVLMTSFCTSDWHIELFRERLTEIYPVDLVEKLLPMGRDNLYKFGKDAISISDEELMKINMYHENNNQYMKAPYELFYKPFYEIKDKLSQIMTDKPKKASALGYQLPLQGSGSNCWVVNGEHTKSGQPMLACDPHLSKSMMSLWYGARLSWNVTDPATGNSVRQYVLGATIVGSPMISHGRSPKFIWGATALNPDVSDLFVEYIRGNMFLSNDKKSWEPLEFKKEVIKVRGGKDVTMNLAYTRNGVLLPLDHIDGTAKEFMPFISNELLEHPVVNGADTWYAYKNVYSTHFQKQHNITTPDFKIAKLYRLISEQVSEPLNATFGVKAFRDYVRIPFNFVMVFPDTGEIAYTIVGKLPHRKYGAHHGAFTKVGYMNDNQWLGIVPDDEMPYVINPKKGYIVQANNHVTSHNVKHGISHNHGYQQRAVRITELLDQKIEAGKKFDWLDMKEIQMDIVDIQVRESLPDMLSLVRKGIDQGVSFNLDMQLVEQLFSSWDASYHRSSPSAALFAMWEFQIASYLQETKIDSIFIRRSLLNLPLSTQAIFKQFKDWNSVNGEARSEICHVLELGSNNSCQQFMAYTLHKSIERMTQKFGAFSEEAWAYQNLAKMTYAHNPFSSIPVLGSLFHEVRAYDGSPRTPNVAHYFKEADESKSFAMKGATTFRMIVDAADKGHCLFVMDAGIEQTSPWSPYRFSQNVLFDNGHYVRLAFNEVGEGIKYKMSETAEPLYLFPGTASDLPKKSKSGCPFADLIDTESGGQMDMLGALVGEHTQKQKVEEKGQDL